MEHRPQAVHVAPLIGWVSGEPLRTRILEIHTSIDRWLGILPVQEELGGETDKLDQWTAADCTSQQNGVR
jgi:hypothetical protein